MIRLDAHIHLRGRVGATAGPTGAAAALAALTAGGFTHGAVMSLSEAESAANLAALAGEPRLLPFAWVDPRRADLAAAVAAAAAAGARGLGEYYPTFGAPDVPAELLRPLLQAAARHSLPVLFHTGDFSYSHPLIVAELARAAPATTIILGHSGSHWLAEAALEAAHMAPNLLLETSGMPDLTVLRRAVAELGAGRVLFGSDYPFWSPQVEHARILAADLGPDDYPLVMGAAAARLFGLQ